MSRVSTDMNKHCNNKAYQRGGPHEELATRRLITTGVKECHGGGLDPLGDPAAEPAVVRREGWVIEPPVLQVVFRGLTVPVTDR